MFEATSPPEELTLEMLPEHEVIEGTGESHVFFGLGSEDGVTGSGLWAVDVGHYFFFFDYEEYVYVLEGEVTVTERGESRTLRPGDMALFPIGCRCEWEVTKPLKKFFVTRTA